MVSIISTPATVVAPSFALSRCITRAMFIRLSDMARDTAMFSSSVTMPMAVSSRLCLSISTR